MTTAGSAPRSHPGPTEHDPIEHDVVARERLMGRAIQEAARGVRGANPLVGAVIADAAGAVLHTGHHRGAGTAHAEADAIARARAAGTDLSRTVLYVSLEPCAHTGRTGPCTEAILAAGIPVVVCAEGDTTSAGGGARWLRERGVRVETGVLAERAHRLNERWWRTREEARPWVTAKVAASLDARVAATDGSSQWITGPAARQHGHGLRALADAILCGTGTALADDPRLTARTPEGESLQTQPLRAVMGMRELPATARLRQEPGHLALRTRDPHRALEILAAEGTTHVLLEGGPGLLGAFLRADLVDELWWHQAPMLLGAGAPAVPDLGVERLGGAHRWEADAVATGDPAGPGVRRLGRDLGLHLRPVPADEVRPSG